MACAAAGNGIGIAGTGYGCSLLAIRSDLTDSSIATAIVQATDRGAHAINMSFGQDGRAEAPAAERRAIDYAFDHDVVLVAAAADQPVSEQGDPANVLQPTGTGPVLASGQGLSVTAADFDDERAEFAGFGTQISLAAYGAFRYRPPVPSGPPGLLGAFPANTTQIESEFPPCGCRTTFQGDDRYAYLQGTSMAAPMVAAVAAMMREANPGLQATDVIRLIEQTATRRPGTGWTGDLGWGILNAGAALAGAKGLDRTPPVSRLTAPRRVEGRRPFTLRWTGRDPVPAGLAASGIARFEVWRSIGGRSPKRIAVTRRRSLRLRGTPPRTYSFFTRAVDVAGNREARPRRPDARTRVVR
jgi:subtilisin family serine protease